MERHQRLADRHERGGIRARSSLLAQRHDRKEAEEADGYEDALNDASRDIAESEDFVHPPEDREEHDGGADVRDDEDPGIERKEDWEEHRDGVLESLSPVGHLEFVLAERVALLSWRLNRVTRFETESIALYQEKIEEDLARERRFGSHVLGADHPEEVRWKLKDAQRTHRTLKKFPALPDDKHLSGGDAAGVLWGVSAYVEDEDLEKVQPPSGVPEWAGVEGDTAEWDSWAVGMVREYVGSMASSAGEAPEELLEAATERARLEVISAKAAAERVEQDLERMSRERLLPRVETLEKVTRYEAHLSRLFHKTLHELEALQVRRSGGSAPLARLDVDGLMGR
jgi:hypothetical protein